MYTIVIYLCIYHISDCQLDLVQYPSKDLEEMQDAAMSAQVIRKKENEKNVASITQYKDTTPPGGVNRPLKTPSQASLKTPYYLAVGRAYFSLFISNLVPEPSILGPADPSQTLIMVYS